MVIISTYNGYCRYEATRGNMDPDLYEDCQAVVGISSSIQIVLVLLSDVWHHHVDQSLHGVMEGCGEALISGQLQDNSADVGTHRSTKVLTLPL